MKELLMGQFGPLQSCAVRQEPDTEHGKRMLFGVLAAAIRLCPCHPARPRPDAIARLYMWSQLGVKRSARAQARGLADEAVNALKTYCSVQRGVICDTECGREHARREMTHILRERGLDVDSGEP